MFYNEKVFFILTCFVLMFPLMGNPISTANAAEQNNDVAITILNESTMRLELLNEDVKIEKDEYGNLIIKKNDYAEILPTMVLDANGNPVDLIYKSTN